MINFEDIKKVIDDLEQYVSSLKTVTETQSELERSNVELSEIKQKLDSLMTEIRNFADVAQQAEQMRNEILSANFATIKDKISGIELQNNNRLNDLEKMVLGVEKSISKRNKVLIFITLAAALIIIGVTFWGKFM